MILDFAKSVFGLLFPISLLLSVFVYKDEKSGDSVPTQKEETTKQESVIRTIGLIVTLAIFLTGVILVNFKYKSLAWICIAVGMPMYLGRVAGTYVSVGIIGKVVRSEKADKLSVREHWAIETVAYTLFFLDVYKLPAKLMELVANIENIPVSDCLYITLYVSRLFLYVFLTCALIPVPLSILAKMLIKANELIRDKTNIYKIGGFFIKRIDPQSMERPLLVKAIEAAKDIAGKVTAALGGRGIFGVELFIKGDEVLFSEVSPRPHDTGMVTMISQDMSEFSLHARAILGLPIPSVRFYGASASKAIVVEGDSTDVVFDNLEEVLAEPDVQLRIFGKQEVKGHRRFGVILALDETVEKALAKAERAYAKLKVIVS